MYFLISELKFILYSKKNPLRKKKLQGTIYPEQVSDLNIVEKPLGEIELQFEETCIPFLKNIQ